MKTVIVASTNPVKIEAARRGFALAFPDESFEFHGVLVPSGVAGQPRSDAETLTGAMNRANAAREQSPDADFWVGLEGGVEEHGGELASFGWVVVRGRGGRMGRAKTGMFYLPQVVAAHIRAGKEVGEADDLVFGLSNSKQGSGAVGILTKNIIQREAAFSHAVILALVPFLHETLYPGES